MYDWCQGDESPELDGYVPDEEDVAITQKQRAIAQVCALYPGTDPEELEARLRRWLKKGYQSAAIVILYRAALRGEEISLDMVK
jgi:hypothetical protein